VVRPPAPVAVQRRFWQEVRAGSSVRDAVVVAGVSRATGHRWFATAGGVIPSFVIEPSGVRLTVLEREEIACLRAAGQGVRVIARTLGRSPSTVSRELGRNSLARRGRYRASSAQAAADARARRPKPAKLAMHQVLRREVQDRLDHHHSPEQIARRLVEDFPDDAEMRVSHETIYRSLYVQGRGALRRDLHQRLRTGRALRRPHRRSDQSQTRDRFAGMVNISERPPEVADRAVPGHWEGDLIVGKDSGSAIGTLVERTTRFVMLLHLPGDHGADAVAEAMITKMTQLPDLLRGSVTWDQGAEMANHASIAAALDLDIYFCDPHSPWQRGSNENTNGLLRQYFPKGTDLSFWGPGYLDYIATELNDRPRKTLNWKTPNEALTQLLSEALTPPGVAPTP
jgi:IS30 family transposase